MNKRKRVKFNRRKKDKNTADSDEGVGGLGAGGEEEDLKQSLGGGVVLGGVAINF